MQGANEIIPLGISTVVIPTDQRNIELDIPVVRLPASSRKKIKSMISRRRSSTAVSFSSDKGARYTLNDGAFLRLQLSVEPGKISPPSLPPTGDLDKSLTHSRGGEVRSGPINKALKGRRKVARLKESKKSSLSQRWQLYMKLRSSKKATSGLESKEVLLDKPSDVSTVTHDFLFEGRNPRPCKPVLDDANGSLGLDMYEMYKIDEETSNSLVMNDSKSASSVSNHNEVNVFIKDTDQISQSLSVPVQAIELSENDTSIMMEDLSHVSQRNDSSVNSRSLADFLDHPPPSPRKGENEGTNGGCTMFANDAATYFSNSLQSILSTNHPQKSLTQKMLRILACDAEYCVDGLEQKLEGCGLLEKACKDDETLTFLTFDDATF